MRLIDISQPLFNRSPNCPAHEEIKCELSATHEKDGWQVERLTCATHSATHLDAPLHKIAGAKSIDSFPPEAFVCDAYISDLRTLPPNHRITPAELEKTLPKNINDCAVLIATGWGQKRSWTQEWRHDGPMLSVDASHWLAERKPRGIGMDYYTIGGSREPNNADTHTVILGHGIWILEELIFSDEAMAAPRPSTLWALPIKLQGGSGCFARAVLQVK